MESQANKKGSAIRRSLMAFAILATPVAAVAGFSGSASADPISTPLPVGYSAVVAVICDEGESISGVTVTIASPETNEGKNTKWDLYLNEIVDPIYNNVSTKSKNLGKYEESFDFIDVAPTLFDIDSFEITVQIVDQDGDYDGGGELVLDETDLLNVDCDLATEDGTVSEVCSGVDAPGIRVVIPNDNPGQGPKYDLYISAPGEEVDFDTDEPADENFSDGYDESFYTGEGVFNVVITGPGEYRAGEFITVNCPIPWRPSPATAAPLIPSTGSESNTLLVIAPMMVLLGGALIVARRRLANA